MKQTRATGLGLIVLILALMGLTACGGDAPATPTATTAPPTATPLPPTPTTQPTAVSGGSGQTGGSTISISDVEKLRNAVRETGNLKNYRYTMSVNATDVEQRANVEGDYVAPDRGYVKGTIGSRQIEQLISGGTVFVKDPSGKWVKRQDPTGTTDPMKIVDPTSFASEANPVKGLNSLLDASKDWRDLGETTINGTKVKHYSFSLDAAKMMGDASSELAKQMGGDLPSLGGGQVWVDPQTQYIHRLSVKMDFAFLVKMLAEAMTAAFSGTPTPGGPSPTALPASDFEIIMDVSKHNDPSITVPQAPQVPSPAAPSATTSSSAPPTVAATVGSNVGIGGTSGATGGGTTKVLNIGQTGEVDGLKVTLQSIRRTTKGALGNADAGKEYVIVKLTFENTTAEDKPVSSILQFAVKDNSGAKYNVDLFSDVQSTPDGSVPVNGKLEGESGFQVPMTAKGLVFEFTYLMSQTTLQFKLDR